MRMNLSGAAVADTQRAPAGFRPPRPAGYALSAMWMIL